MRIPIGIVCSVLGATIAFYLAIITLVTLPADGSLRWFAIAGIASLSLTAGILINGVSMQDFRKVSRDLRETSHLYDTLTSRLSPLLYSGIEDVLHRRVRELKQSSQMRFTVFTISEGVYRTVASTFPQGDPVRQSELKFGEGIPGYLAERKIAGFGITSWNIKDSPNRPIFDRAGLLIGEIPPLPDDKRGKTPPGEKWLYARPIFERTTATPWSNRLVGILAVNSTAEDADNYFKTEEFQQLVDSVATEVSPYLDAIQVLVAEQKL